MSRPCLFSLLVCLGCHSAGIRDLKVPVGSLSLHLVCQGEGQPIVVLESGLGNDARAWSKVQPEIAEFTTVCAYDRAGRGLSSPAPYPHSNQQMADELHALLQAAKLPGPYVLVGHSMGGTNIQLLAVKHPESVAGMVLVDWSVLPPPFEHTPGRELAEFERNLREMEGLDRPTLLAGLAQLKASNLSLGDRPLVILAAGKSSAPDFLTEAQSRELFAKHLAALERAQTMSSRSVFVTAAESTHHIPLETPGYPIRAIQAVVQSLRTGEPLSEQKVR